MSVQITIVKVILMHPVHVVNGSSPVLAVIKLPDQCLISPIKITFKICITTKRIIIVKKMGNILKGGKGGSQGCRGTSRSSGQNGVCRCSTRYLRLPLDGGTRGERKSEAQVLPAQPAVLPVGVL